jgi:glycosyltransferase involved in cell wall biosynthesis
MKICYVVHRYAPFPGGSENYVRDMAEETLKRGHEVAVFAGEHKGDLNGVRVSSDAQILLEKWDLIVVHGGDVGLQNFVLQNAKNIPSPIMYMLILPSNNPIPVQALKDVKYIACSTNADWDHVEKYGVKDKAVQVNHGIDFRSSLGTFGFREKYRIKQTKMFLSCGGYWPNKAMGELSDMFNDMKLEDSVLVLTGYDNRNNLMPKETEYVKPFLIDDRADVMSAIKESDLYILHSYSEGFGLVLLESMLNNTPWAARHIAGAASMHNNGFTYTTNEELKNYLQNYQGVDFDKRVHNMGFVMDNHLISNTVDGILSVVNPTI